MSMLRITGQLINVFEKPATVRDGKELAAKPQVQIMGNIALPNGENRMELITLSTDDPQAFSQFKAKEVSVPVGVFAPSKGSIIYYIPRGSKPVAA